METLSLNKSHGGTQGVYRHESTSTGTPMIFSVFVPEGKGPFPVLTYLSGLTCTHANVTEKGEYRAACAQHKIIFVAPDTSPRGEGVADDDAYDFGQGAGFYLDATQAPFSEHFKMGSYIERELPDLIAANFPADMQRQGITGHSMGGHGALTIGLRHPRAFKSVSAFSPICHPSDVSWGKKAFGGYLGDDTAAWRAHDAVCLIEDGARTTRILVDQGIDDQFLAEQLRPEALEAACKTAKIPLTLRMQEGYDHSYYFVSSFLDEHIAWHARYLKA
ncbi:S-formylglutathione hydrolase [Litorimonas sp. WD9-15]|uniref:S-formylglutathione hydrolase n=1 Tax=Litorimonas sp. WD9-15 TaxID=3418716 RepID=UPI003CFCDCC5